MLNRFADFLCTPDSQGTELGHIRIAKPSANCPGALSAVKRGGPQVTMRRVTRAGRMAVASVNPGEPCHSGVQKARERSNFSGTFCRQSRTFAVACSVFVRGRPR